MPRHVEVKPGKNLTITGPANVHIKGGPALSGTQPVPGEYEPQENAHDQSTPGPPEAAAAETTAAPAAPA